MTEAWKKWEGQVVNGQFHLGQYLGGSDHSAVFLTERGGPEPQKAAIKLIPANAANAEAQLARWKLAAKLEHPHLLRLFETGRCELGETALVYVVMERADEDLSEIFPTRALRQTEVRDMLEPALEALAYLHGKGFVHGHIQPANIMAVNEQLKLSSDGVCRAGEPGGGQGKPGRYDPPEATSGQISTAGDVWSLGMTLVEALTQRLPIWEKVGRGEPMLPETLPAEFAEIARHCLRRDPERRWRVQDIAALLKPASLPPPIEAASPRVPKKNFWTWRYAAPVAAAVAILAGAVAGPKLFDHHAEAGRDASMASEEPKTEPEAARPRETPEAARPATKASERKKVSSEVAAPRATPRPEAPKTKPAREVVRGEVVQQVVPEISEKARDTIHGTVRVNVRVRVDADGNVAGAEFDSPGPSQYFANQAMQAARRWKFAAATVDGRNAPSEWVLRFEFSQAGPRAVPVQVTR
jgi:TonB family protein